MSDTEPESVALAIDRRGLVRLLARLTAYYVAVGLLLVLAWAVAPGFIAALPTGGVGAIALGDGAAVAELEEALLNADEDELDIIARETEPPNSWLTDARTLALAMLGTVVLMLPVSWVYKCINKSGTHDHSLDETALILPGVVAGIVLIVQHSLALAFSLAGIVAGVQFRRALSDTFDTLFIFVAIGVGIAAGISALEIAAVLSVFFSYATTLTCALGDGLESQYALERKRQRRLRKAAAQPVETLPTEKDKP